MSNVSAPTKTRALADAISARDRGDEVALARALNDYARAAEDEARKARQARDTEIRRLYAAGVLPHELAAALDGVSVRRIHQIKCE